MNNFKIAFLGNESTGKTGVARYLYAGKPGATQRLLNWEFDARYIPTLGVEAHPCEADGRVLNVWDCAGQEKFGGLRDGYYICADAAVVFHDITFNGITKNLSLPQSVSHWVRDFRRVCEDKPIVHVMAKADLLTDEQRAAVLEKNPGIIFVSGKTGEGIDELTAALPK